MVILLLKRGMKTCRKCLKTKPLLEFYSLPRNCDGRTGKCKSCVLEDRKIYRASNKEKLREYERARCKQPSRVERQRRLSRLRYYANKEKSLARCKLHRAVKSGKIHRLPCEICGDSKVHGHHTDYSRPLDVVWLCPIHHYEEHQRMT